MVIWNLLHGPPSVEEAWKGLSFWKKRMVDIGGSVSIGMYQPPGHSGPTEYFIFRDRGKLYIDCEHNRSLF